MDSTKLKPKPPKTAHDFRDRLEACTSADEVNKLGRAFADNFANIPDNLRRDLRAEWHARREELARKG